MIKSRFYILLVLITALFFVSCKDPNEYRVDAEFTDYLNRFVQKGASRGHTFDLTANGLIIEFAKLKNNNAGLTHYEDPIRIEIDKTYWTAIGKTAGADMMKEDLIFHELGHGLLNRKHLNATLENGDWKSIMCGGEKVNGRAWNINYKGIRRNYYIDELFDESTQAPDFSSNLFLVDSIGFKQALALDFNTVQTAGWALGEDDKHKMSIETTNGNGRLRFQSKVTDTYLVFVKTNIDVLSDFSYELNLEYNSTDLTGQYGVIFGHHVEGSSGSNEQIEYFTINNNRNMYMGNRTWYSFFTELYKPQVLPRGKNTLKVFKIGTMIYYFINNVYSYSSEMETSVSGVYFGFLVPTNGVVLLDNLSISQKAVSGASAKIKQNQQPEFDAITFKSLNQGIILNK
jgi:hypothetical protein